MAVGKESTVAADTQILCMPIRSQPWALFVNSTAAQLFLSLFTNRSLKIEIYKMYFANKISTMVQTCLQLEND